MLKVALGRWGRWCSGTLERWNAEALGAGALGRWGAGALGRWGAGALGRWAVGALCPSHQLVLGRVVAVVLGSARLLR